LGAPRAPRGDGLAAGVELRWGASWGNEWERAGGFQSGRAPLAFIGADGKETSASRRDDGVRCPPPLPAQGRGDAATRDAALSGVAVFIACSCVGGPKPRDMDRDGDSSSVQQISFSFIALDNPVMSKSISDSSIWMRKCLIPEGVVG